MTGNSAPGDVEAAEERDRIAEQDLTRFHRHLLGAGGVNHAIQGHEVGVRLVHHLLGGQFEKRRITERQAGPGDDGDRLAARAGRTTLVATADGDFADLDERIGQADRPEGRSTHRHLGTLEDHRDTLVQHRYRVVDGKDGGVLTHPQRGFGAESTALGIAGEFAIQRVALGRTLGIAVQDQAQRAAGDTILVAARRAGHAGGSDLDAGLARHRIHLLGVSETAGDLDDLGDAQTQRASDLQHGVLEPDIHLGHSDRLLRPVEHSTRGHRSPVHLEHQIGDRHRKRAGIKALDGRQAERCFDGRELPHRRRAVGPTIVRCEPRREHAQIQRATLDPESDSIRVIQRRQSHQTGLGVEAGTGSEIHRGLTDVDRE